MFACDDDAMMGKKICDVPEIALRSGVVLDCGVTVTVAKGVRVAVVVVVRLGLDVTVCVGELVAVAVAVAAIGLLGPAAGLDAAKASAGWNGQTRARTTTAWRQ